MKGLFYFLFLSASCSFLPAEGSKEGRGPINREETPFVFEDCKMYYKGKEFQLGWHIKEYEKVFGKGYRRVDPIGSFGFDNLFTYDSLGIMMVGQTFGTPAQKDTIKQINIIFNYTLQELSSSDKQEGLTDQMQKSVNRTWPSKVFNQKLLLNGVELQFGPQGMTVREANKSMQKVGLSFDQYVLKYLWRCVIWCQYKIDDSVIIYSLIVEDDNPQMVQEMDIF